MPSNLRSLETTVENGVHVAVTVRVGEDLWVRVPDDCDVTRAAAFVLALRAGLPS